MFCELRLTLRIELLRVSSQLVLLKILLAALQLGHHWLRLIYHHLSVLNYLLLFLWLGYNLLWLGLRSTSSLFCPHIYQIPLQGFYVISQKTDDIWSAQVIWDLSLPPIHLIFYVVTALTLIRQILGLVFSVLPCEVSSVQNSICVDKAHNLLRLNEELNILLLISRK